MNVTVIGIGAMGGGMARALLTDASVNQVVGYDRATVLAETFYNESVDANKACAGPPQRLGHAVGPETTFCILVLVNEAQCQQVCFDQEENLLSLLPKGSCLVVCSTVTATFIRQAQQRFQSKGIYFVDCPISGGPVRAGKGELTMMASGDQEALDIAMPLLDILGNDIHVVKGGAGMSSTVKMVHQLLAGVHICAAAEALALAAKAGLNVEQVYKIVQGAAGNSWMFSDRGKRMLAEPDKVMSALDIFVKDLDICHSEAKALQSPIPLCSAALQQFIGGQSMGLGKQDDSQVVKVYENVTGARVARTSTKKSAQGSLVGDLWILPDGTKETILEVGDEPRHNVVLVNEYVRAIRVEFPPNDTTCAHRHAEDSLYFFLGEGGLDIVNHVQGSHPACDCVEFGEVRYGTHKTDAPLVHKITNKSKKDALCIDAEILKQPPVVAAIPLVATHHELIKTRSKCRVYKFTLEPGQSVELCYPFYYVVVVVNSSTIENEMGSSRSSIKWQESLKRGDLQWKEPVVALKQTNIGDSAYQAFIAEWR